MLLVVVVQYLELGESLSIGKSSLRQQLSRGLGIEWPAGLNRVMRHRWRHQAERGNFARAGCHPRDFLAVGCKGQRLPHSLIVERRPRVVQEKIISRQLRRRVEI